MYSCFLEILTLETLQLNIKSRKKDDKIGFLANLNDFSCSNGVRIDPSLIIKNPQISMYCFDDTNKNAVFVEVPQDIDLTKSPFVYQTQYENAQRIILVPYETFNKLANSIPEVHHPIFIYMAGRSGSTLLSNIFNESRVAVSLSEPDVATQIAHLRYDVGASRIPEVRDLAQSTIRFLFKSYHTDGIQAHALKFRSEGIRIADLLQDAFPRAKNLFLYRDAISWITSFYQLIQRNYDMPDYSSVNAWIKRYETLKHADFSHLTSYLDKKCAKVSIPEQLALWLIAIIEWHQEQVELGTPMLAVRYSDLIQYREGVLQSVFTYCGLPMSSSSVGLRAFSRDSQAGSPHARINPKVGNRLKLNKQQIRSILLILKRHPILSKLDFNVSGTLLIEKC